MSRRRVKADKRPYKKQKVLLMIVEGETEFNYISYLKYVYNRNINLRIITKSKLTSNIKSDLERFSRSTSVSLNEIVLVYDLENSVSEYNKFIKDDKLIHKRTYLMQPCIETHFLMHYKGGRIKNDEFYDAKEVLNRLKKFSPNYKKGKSYSWGKSNVSFKMLEHAKNESIKHFNGFDDYNFSMLGYLIKDYFR